ncbi:MAG: hypothetical protein JSU70_22180 [Phycisphaerales bacterium]|nr:MAG: hypothetical protein JSU70_22180 [Phycisphaerales bacterium]
MSPIDPLIVDRVVESIREKHPEFDVKIDATSARGLAPSIKFTVQQEEHKEPALAEVTKIYPEYIRRLEADKCRLSTLLAQALDNNRLQMLLLAGTVDRVGDTVHAEPGSVVATRGASVHIEHIQKAIELQKAITKSKGLPEVAKEKALDVIGGAIEAFANGQLKEAAKQILELGKDLGPVMMNTGAYAFFKNWLG